MAELCSVAVGVSLVVLSFSLARKSNGTGYYSVFWVGMASIYTPLFWNVLKRIYVLPTVFIAGAVTMTPKLSWGLGAPVYYDETSHYFMLLQIIKHGAPFQYSPTLPVATNYPGLETAASTIHFLTDLSPWTSALVLVIVAHTFIPATIYLCARTVPVARRFAGLAAIVYTINPSFWYGDSQFAYESLALLFAFATVWLYLQALQSHSAREALAWTVASVVVGFATVVTHHVTALLLSVSLILITVCSVTDLRRHYTRQGRAAVSFCLVTPVLVATASGLWIGLVAPDTVSYLSPRFAALGQTLSNTLFHHASHRVTDINGATTGTRTVFAGSTLPRYEIVAGVLAPFAIAAICAFPALDWIRRLRFRQRSAWAYLLAAGYFISVPITLIAAGAAPAHRSWGYSYLGISVVVAVLVSTRHRFMTTGFFRAVFVVLLAVVMVGNAAVSVAADYRFPGPYQFGSDTRDVSSETITMAKWVKQHLGPGTHILTDRYTGAALIAYAGSYIPLNSGSLPFAEIWYDLYPPGSQLMRKLEVAGDRYLVVDTSITDYAAADGTTPFVGRPAIPLPAEYIARFNSWPWMSLLFQTEHYRVYRISFSTYFDWYPHHEGRTDGGSS